MISEIDCSRQMGRDKLQNEEIESLRKMKFPAETGDDGLLLTTF